MRTILFVFSTVLNTANGSTCTYWLMDKSGDLHSRLLYDLGVNLTISGDWTYSSVDKFNPKCYSIKPSMFHSMNAWISMISTYSTLQDCCQHQILECLQHHLPEERGKDFVNRVLNTCTRFQGRVSQILCRDGKEGTNVINRITLVSDDTPTKEPMKLGCQTGDNTIFQHPNDFVLVDVERGIIQSASSLKIQSGKS
ncbi:hypothetical protein RF11_12083 [Thelohanellus kitauei]|uniref:Uncharacterized protein n=1 Tax=Thelohanellus kitauei TaxID=669202 RepID=A0A0C2MU28_THEKT|nr:hypothetical protein RF11_12083 [Thelohanellus kitauei]